MPGLINLKMYKMLNYTPIDCSAKIYSIHDKCRQNLQPCKLRAGFDYLYALNSGARKNDNK